MIYRIRNWRRFQHYKDRNPPWIKLHREILSSLDWVVLDNDGRALAIACMVLAAGTEDGSFDGDPDYVRRVGYFESVDFNPLIACGFLEIEGDASDCKQMLADACSSVSVSVSNSVSKKEGGAGGTKRFIKPTQEQVQEYLDELGETRFTGQEFVDSNSSKGWVVGKNQTPMKDWKAAVNTWRRFRDKDDGKNPRQVGATPTEHPWHQEDVREYGEHERWDEYLEMCLALPRSKWPAPRFAKWSNVSLDQDRGRI
jgi:hypothetical protein